MTQNVDSEKFDARQWYVAKFQLFENGLNGRGEMPFHDTRKQAIASFAELGFPTTRDEEWKYTNVAPILRRKFQLAPGEASPVSRADVQPYLFAGFEHNVVVFVNGRYRPDLSEVETGDRGVLVMSLREALETQYELVGRHLGRYAHFESETFTALNTAFVNDGLFVYVPEESAAEKPLQLLYLTDAREQEIAVYPRNLIVVEPGARIQLVESYHSLNDAGYFTNAVTEAVVAANASLQHIKVQMESLRGFHISSTQVQQEGNSYYSSVNLDFGGALVRNNLNVRLNGEHCETHLYGFYLGRGAQHIDNHTFIDHATPHCFSNELYKGILDGRAQGVFNGKILVRPGAQKTNALQSNKTLLLTNDAAVNAKPQLEIFADDVRCTHGATIGQLDDEALFYLRARGIRAETAEAMLRYAFASDVFEGIEIETVRARVEQEVFERLRPVERE